MLHFLRVSPSLPPLFSDAMIELSTNWKLLVSSLIPTAWKTSHLEIAQDREAGKHVFMHDHDFPQLFKH